MILLSIHLSRIHLQVRVPAKYHLSSVFRLQLRSRWVSRQRRHNYFINETTVHLPLSIWLSWLNIIFYFAMIQWFNKVWYASGFTFRHNFPMIFPDAFQQFVMRKRWSDFLSSKRRLLSTRKMVVWGEMIDSGRSDWQIWQMCYKSNHEIGKKHKFQIFSNARRIPLYCTVRIKKKCPCLINFLTRIFRKRQFAILLVSLYYSEDLLRRRTDDVCFVIRGPSSWTTNSFLTPVWPMQMFVEKSMQGR